MKQTDVRDFMRFAADSPTAFQAVCRLSETLSSAGFLCLNENDDWQIKRGGQYYVTRNQSAVIAFKVPEKGHLHFQIVASHSDSPLFKLKPTSEQPSDGHYIRLAVEKYGGMIMSSWFDRPLGIAGRVTVRKENGIVSVPVDLGRDAVLIPNMPIHFNREVNDGYKYDPKTDLLPLYAQGTETGELQKELAAAAGVPLDALLSGDLYLYCRTPGSVWGADNAFFSCPRIDNLECAYASLHAFLSAECTEHMDVYAVFDNEEVGSSTRQGADSSFLSDVLFRVGSALGLSEAQLRANAASSFMVSADNAHAVHPNHSETYDALNRSYMNGGVVIKHNANQRYTTDAVSDAVFSEICRRADVPVQHFSNRSDIAGGSTLGNIANTHLSMNTVDIGLAQLAMHSCYETAGVKDLAYMTDALRAFYESEIRMKGDGSFEF